MASRGRVVRRTPLTTRVKAYLNPLDFLLWISEELNSNDWDDFQEQWAASIGLIFNILFMVARSNASSKSSTRGDDIFGDHDERKGNGWMSWMVSHSFGKRFEMADADNLSGLLYCTLLDTRVISERLFRLLPQAILSVVRIRRECHPEYIFRTPSAR